MQSTVIWQDKMAFLGEAEGHQVVMDAKSPIGAGSGFTPKELVALGIAGCTAMDVVSLLKKYRQPLQKFEVMNNVTHTEGSHPTVFKDVDLVYKLEGELEESKVIEAVRLSQTKYCGVSAMISKTAPIRYRIELNGKQISTGEAAFEF